VEYNDPVLRIFVSKAVSKEAIDLLSAELEDVNHWYEAPLYWRRIVSYNKRAIFGFCVGAMAMGFRYARPADQEAANQLFAAIMSMKQEMSQILSCLPSSNSPHIPFVYFHMAMKD